MRVTVTPEQTQTAFEAVSHQSLPATRTILRAPMSSITAQKSSLTRGARQCHI
jgi:hypothetical protein